MNKLYVGTLLLVAFAGRLYANPYEELCKDIMASDLIAVCYTAKHEQLTKDQYKKLAELAESIIQKRNLILSTQRQTVTTGYTSQHGFSNHVSNTVIRPDSTSLGLYKHSTAASIMFGIWATASYFALMLTAEASVVPAVGLPICGVAAAKGIMNAIFAVRNDLEETTAPGPQALYDQSLKIKAFLLGLSA